LISVEVLYILTIPIRTLFNMCFSGAIFTFTRRCYCSWTKHPPSARFWHTCWAPAFLYAEYSKVIRAGAVMSVFHLYS